MEEADNGVVGEFPTWGNYTVPKGTDFKEYYISQEDYNDDFGTMNVIAPVEESTGNNRFYVMALEDFDSNTHSWYSYADGRLSSSYNIGTNSNDFAISGAEPTGKLNTERMIASWNASQYGTQNANDMWGIIQQKETDGKSKIEKGWFVPSKSEWSAFQDAFNITSSNYSNTFGLKDRYWSSTQRAVNLIFFIYNSSNTMSSTYPTALYYVRLATTF